MAAIDDYAAAANTAILAAMSKIATAQNADRFHTDSPVVTSSLADAQALLAAVGAPPA